MEPSHSPNYLIFKLICAIYVYMMAMSAIGVISCEQRKRGECGEQWTQIYTISGGALTTLWAYITDNPLRTEDFSRKPGPKTTGVATRRRKEGE